MVLNTEKTSSTRPKRKRRMMRLPLHCWLHCLRVRRVLRARRERLSQRILRRLICIRTPGLVQMTCLRTQLSHASSSWMLWRMSFMGGGGSAPTRVSSASIVTSCLRATLSFPRRRGMRTRRPRIWRMRSSPRRQLRSRLKRRELR